MPDKYLITRSTPELESALATILEWLAQVAPGTNPKASAAVRYAIVNTATEIRTQKENNKMNTISINNGLSTTTPEAAIETLGMDVIRNAMDDDICQQVEADCPNTNIEFINLYLQHTAIVIG